MWNHTGVCVSTNNSLWLCIHLYSQIILIHNNYSRLLIYRIIWWIKNPLKWFIDLLKNAPLTNFFWLKTWDAQSAQLETFSGKFTFIVYKHGRQKPDQYLFAFMQFLIRVYFTLNEIVFEIFRLNRSR